MDAQTIESILERVKDHVTDKEREFLFSSIKYAAKKGSASYGQERWIKDINAKYSPEKVIEIDLSDAEKKQFNLFRSRIQNWYRSSME